MELTTGELKLRGSVQGNFSCEWTIANFSSLDWQVGKNYISPKFQLDNEGIKWCLTISCEKRNENFRAFVYRFAKVNGNIKPEDINFRCNISIRNTDGEILCRRPHADLAIGIGTSCPQSIKSEDLISKLISDTLVVTVEATYSILCYSGGAGIQCYQESAPTLKMSDDYRNLWRSKENTDCVIFVEGQDIPVHSVILGARSKVFAAMFRHDTLEKIIHRVEVTDFKKGTMDRFLEFIYSGSVLQMDYELALELLRASDKYEVGDLESYCSNYLMSALNNENVCQVLVSADIHNAGKLRSEAMKYICENFDSTGVFETNRAILQAKSELLFDIIKKFIERKEAEDIKSDGRGDGANKRRRNE